MLIRLVQCLAQIEKHHWPFGDPAKIEGSEEDILAGFRRVRDEIREKFEAYARELKPRFGAGGQPV